MKVGRRKITYRHDNFAYYQPNDHVTGDCSIRAVSFAFGEMNWLETYDMLCDEGRKLLETPTSTETVGKVLTDHGFRWHGIKGNKPTVHEFAEQNPTLNCVLRLSHHLTAVRDGKYHDIWDCGDKSVYGYWEQIY